MTSPMQRVSSFVSADIGNYLANKKTWSMVYVLSQYAKGNGTTGDAGSINNLIEKIGTDPATIAVDPGTYRIDDDATVPSNITLWFLQGGLLQTDSDVTVTINGSIETGLYQIFSGSGTITGLTRVPTIYPQWWGAKGDNINDDTTAFQKAISSRGSTGGTIHVPIGHYLITDTIYINTPITLIGDGYSWSDGKTYLNFKMSGKPLSSPAILIDTTQNITISGFYISNGDADLRNGIDIDGTIHGATAGFITIAHCLIFGFDKNVHVNDSWFFHFIDIHSKGGNFGFYIQGGSITTTYFDHCYADGNATYGYYINGAYYTTLVACACDSQLTGYKISNAQAVAMIGCGSESTINTAIDIDNSTVTIDGFTSVSSGTGNDSNFATMLNVQSGHVEAKCFSEINIPEGTTKIASIALSALATGSYNSSGQELLGIFYPKNGKFLFNGQAYTNGLPTGMGWKTTDIGKVVYESIPVQAGTTPNKYVKFGYQRLTSGDGNVLNTDWLELRALTGN